MSQDTFSKLLAKIKAGAVIEWDSYGYLTQDQYEQIRAIDLDRKKHLPPESEVNGSGWLGGHYWW